MFEWWDTLSFIQKFFYFIAIPSTVLLALQTVLSLIGIGIDADIGDGIGMDTAGLDFDADGFSDSSSLSEAADFRFVSLRGIIAFATIFGWTGAALTQGDTHIAIILVLSTICGLIAMTVIALLFFGVSKLQGSGNISYRNAVGSPAEVYIPIPANQSGVGKVMVTVQERLIEVDAITSEPELLRTGERVTIIDLYSPTTLIVARMNK